MLTNVDAITGEFLSETVGVSNAASRLIVVERGVVDGTNPGGRCEIVGVGPVPHHILATLSPDTELAGMIFDGKGRPLWLGRSRRLANVAQRLVVAIRDGGCFQCGAPMHRFELHHIREWHRDGGPTDIANLVAVCRQHDKQIRTHNLQVLPHPSGGYRTTPRNKPPP